MNYNQQVLKQYNLSVDDLTDLVRARGVEPLMLVITGSHMWHTATSDSDLDIRGVYLQPTCDFHGLDQPKGTIEANGVLGKDIDIQLYELAHLYRMLLGHNGNVVEMMLSPTIIYEEGIWSRCWRDRPDRSSCNIAELFLTKRLAKYYTGYFHSQRKRAGQNRGGKALVYSYRELMAGTVLMATGKIIYNLDELAFLYDRDYRAVPLLAQYRSDWNVPQGSVELTAFEEDWADMIGIMQQATDSSCLPDREPTWARDELEYKVRMTRWDDIQVRAFNDR